MNKDIARLIMPFVLPTKHYAELYDDLYETKYFTEHLATDILDVLDFAHECVSAMKEYNTMAETLDWLCNETKHRETKVTSIYGTLEQLGTGRPAVLDEIANEMKVVKACVIDWTVIKGIYHKHPATFRESLDLELYDYIVGKKDIMKSYHNMISRLGPKKKYCN
jgi:hypothetical protein